MNHVPMTIINRYDIRAIHLNRIVETNYEYSGPLISRKLTFRAKNFDSGQPVQSAQADLNRYFL